MAERRVSPVTPLLGLALIGLPFVLLLAAEIAVVILVFQWIGWWTLLALFATSLIGIYLFLHEGRKHVAELRRSAEMGALPLGNPGDALLIGAGSLLLLLPGFVTDVIGLIFALPFTRPLVRRAFGWWFRTVSGIRRPSGANAKTTIKGEVIREEETEEPEGSRETKDDGPRYLEGTVVEVDEDEERQ